MLKDIRSKVMQIANRLVGQGYIRRNAMETAWKLIRYRALRTRINGTTFDNRQNVLQLLCKYNPADITVKLVRDYLNAFDRNAVAVVAGVKDKVRAVIGYLPKAVANTTSVLMDKGFEVSADTLSIVGGYAEQEYYGARICFSQYIGIFGTFHNITAVAMISHKFITAILLLNTYNTYIFCIEYHFIFIVNYHFITSLFLFSDIA